ncbi:MAG: CBS domain-containing protein [Proteobacteria bacterium]|nr:CBS domain-containing protein [Pseudomonadota bacterium]
MKIRRRMAHKPITIHPDKTIVDALKLMKKHSIRHLPVIDGEKFVGFVSEFDVREVRLLPMTEEIKIRDVMIKNPITIGPDENLEDAARLIYENKIGGLPVLESGKLVGVITSKDILAAFIEIMGVLESSSRIDVVLGDKPHAFEEVSRVVKENGGNIISVGMTTHAERSNKKVYYFRLERCDVEAIAEAIKKKHYEIVAVMG